jgi:predicted esterase
MSQENKLRALCLHGFNQNVDDMKERMKSIMSRGKSQVEYLFLQAQHPLPNGKFAWFYYSESEPLQLDWTKVIDAIDDEKQLLGLEASLQQVVEFIRKNTVDIILGFSQGAALLSILAHKELLPSQQRLMFVGGFRPLKHISRFIGNYPSIHCMGTKDEIIDAKFSQDLADSFQLTTSLPHTGKHVIPRLNLNTIVFPKLIQTTQMDNTISTVATDDAGSEMISSHKVNDQVHV